MEFPLFGCPYSGVVNDYFENVYSSGQPMIERAEIRDIDSIVLLEELEQLADPRKDVLKNVLTYANSLESTLIRVIRAYHKPAIFFRPHLGDQFETPSSPEPVFVEERYSFECIVPSDKRFVVLPVGYGLRIRFPYIDSEMKFISETLESRFTVRSNGDQLGNNPVDYQPEQILKDRDLLFYFWFNGTTNQYLEESKSQLEIEG